MLWSRDFDINKVGDWTLWESRNTKLTTINRKKFPPGNKLHYLLYFYRPTFPSGSSEVLFLIRIHRLRRTVQNRKKSSLKLTHSCFCCRKMFVKVSVDIALHNAMFITHLTTLYPISETKCTSECTKVTEGQSNFAKFSSLYKRCDCYHASEEFRDSRAVAPEADMEWFLVHR